MKRKQNATASSLACHLLQLQLHIHQTLQSKDSFTFKNPLLQARQCPSWAIPWPLKTAITPTIKTSVANSDELLQQFLAAFTFLTDACRQSWILALRWLRRCHWDHGLHSIKQWMAHPGRPLTCWMSCSMLSGSSRSMSSLHKRYTLTPCSEPTVPSSEFLSQAKSTRTLLPGSLCLLLLGLGLLACASASEEVAAAPSTLDWPPWLKTSWNISWTCSWGSMLAALQAMLAVTSEPDVPPLMGSSSSTISTAAGGHSGTSSSSKGSCEASEASYS